MAAPAQEIIVGGKAFRCLAPVRSWHTTGFHFLTRMRASTRLVVNHWTGAENSAERCYRNMRDGRVSVQFIVDQLGEVYQCADADARCAHAVENGGNTFGVGIEIINRGHSNNDAKGFNRTRITETIHKRPVTYGEFFTAQIASVVALNQALCSAYGIPMRVPVANGGDVYPTMLPPTYLASFRGVVGHFHLDRDKVDPGLELLRRIHSAGLELPVA